MHFMSKCIAVKRDICKSLLQNNNGAVVYRNADKYRNAVKFQKKPT